MNNFPVSVIPFLSDVLPVLREYHSMSPADFAMKVKPDSLPIPVADAARLLDCYQRASQKFPTLHREGMLYTRKAIEQSTGEAVMTFKKRLFKGDTAIDLTGGLGMDSIFLADEFENVTYVEKDAVVCKAASHNHKLLGYDNIRHYESDAEEWLKQKKNTVFDLIYIDPSRRDSNKRFFRLRDCEPDVRLLYPILDTRTRLLVVKVSPLYDIQQLTREIPAIRDIYVISVNGEVKEVLSVSEPQEMVADEEPTVHAVALDKQGNETEKVSAKLNESTPADTAIEPMGFLYEPDATIIKAGLTEKYAVKLGIKKLNQGSDYLTSDKLIPDFCGKKFLITAVIPFKPRIIKQFLKEQQIEKVMIHKRDFPQTVDVLYKKFGLSMGNQAHLFFTKHADGGLIMLVAEDV